MMTGSTNFNSLRSAEKMTALMGGKQNKITMIKISPNCGLHLSDLEVAVKSRPFS